MLVTRRLSDPLPGPVPPHVEILALPSDATGRSAGRRCWTNSAAASAPTCCWKGVARSPGGFVDAGLIDEVWTFLAPKLLGGTDAPVPLAGRGLERVPEAGQLHGVTVDRCGEDLLVRGAGDGRGGYSLSNTAALDPVPPD